MVILTRFLIAGVIALFGFQNSIAQTGSKANTTSAAPAAKAPADTASTVSPGEAVITVHGVCDKAANNTASDASACTTVVTREQFENLMQALHPGQPLPATARNNLGKLYGEYLAVEAATRKAGMEDTVEFREFTTWMRLLSASEYYRRKLQQKFSNPPQEEIDAYYKQHLSDFETVKLARVLIPRESAAADKNEFEKKAHEMATTAHANLAKGMDPTEIQKNAYTALGLEVPPPVDLGNRRRKDLIADESTDVFSLKPGEVSQIHAEPRNYVIYKVLSRDTTPQENVKSFLSGQITQEKYREAMKTIIDSAPADLNDQYFLPPPPTEAAPMLSPHTIVAH